MHPHRGNAMRPGSETRLPILGSRLARSGEADHYGCRDAGIVAWLCRMLESQTGDDVLAVLVQPLRGPQERPGVIVAGYRRTPTAR